MEEIVAHGRTGWLVPWDEPAAYARAIDRLLRDPAMRQQMGDAARERLSGCFPLSRQISHTGQVLSFPWAGPPAGPEIFPPRPPSMLQRLHRYSRQEGLARTARRLAETACAPWYRHERLWFLWRSLSEPVKRLRCFKACTIRMATAEDAGRLAALGFDGYAELLERLTSSHDVCCIAEGAGDVLAFQWAVVGRRSLWIEPIEQWISLPEGQAHLVRCRALNAVQGHGVIPAIEAELFSWLAQRGVQEVTTNISSGHPRSLKTFERLGFRRIRCVTLQRWGWITRRRVEEVAPPHHTRSISASTGA